MKSFYSFLYLLIFSSSCSVLVGQVTPVEEKSPLSLAQKANTFPNQTWKKLDITSSSAGNEDIPDAAWQSPTTAAVISINSVCRQGADDHSDVKVVTKILLSQWENLKIEKETSLNISGFPALETTARGNYLNRERKFQTVVIKTTSCVFELVYLSPVSTFQQEASVFQAFRDNLILK